MTVRMTYSFRWWNDGVKQKTARPLFEIVTFQYKIRGGLLFQRFPSSFLILLSGYHNEMNLEAARA